MATAVTAPAPPEQRFRLSAVSWETYVLFSDGLGPRHVRVTYDRGEMELMTLSSEHERAKRLLGLFVTVVALEMDIDVTGLGSMTFRREDLERGLEPDECFWVANEPAVRGRRHVDLSADPPPDLVIEVEISRSSLDRLALWGQLGVPEVWRCDGRTLRVCRLKPDRTYEETDRGLAFPFLPAGELVRFLNEGGELSETQAVRSFQKWVREQKARGWKSGHENGETS